MGNFTIISSIQDIASLNIYNMLIKKFDFKKSNDEFDRLPIFYKDKIKLVQIRSDLIFADYINEISSDLFIFVSRHESKSKNPCLTAHFPGNFSSDNSYGGKGRELGYCCPSFHKKYINMLWQMKDLIPNYQIVTEPMHHGPTSVQKPTIFIEIGSSLKEWRDEKAVDVVVNALIETITSSPIYDKIGIAFGGTHYSKKFTKFLLNSQVALGAIVPKYALSFIDFYIIKQMIEKSSEKVEYAILDGKGLGIEKKRLLEILEQTDLEIIQI